MPKGKRLVRRLAALWYSNDNEKAAADLSARREAVDRHRSTA
eukprot:CAMPEP_0204577224 /NCGR_PEP_ID=MMETSP0661-20131031/42224_1 /ASSEMBLY_ACC=CAM_ASM_000606 /TAXON_ID=109239 /ORGANISM="Alexandrium margalefi, Strain AMGDE01CS-322" /LENGTH=41 /DNA_ID= /DNA_START= /DNA_END= /DNA_ORIENTATION=